jgi:hypothetical protein
VERRRGGSAISLLLIERELRSPIVNLMGWKFRDLLICRTGALKLS